MDLIIHWSEVRVLPGLPFFHLTLITKLFLPELNQTLIFATQWPATVAVHEVSPMADKSFPAP